MYPYIQPQQQWLPFPQQPQIVPHFVSSIEEARASMIDPLSVHVFMDSSNGKIYVKKMGDKGLSEFFVYSQEEAPKDPISEINARLSRIENFIGGKDDKSISNDVSIKQSEPVSVTAVAEQNERYDATEPTGVSEDARNDWWKKRN